jgi:outer membrane lipoprotein-sorting protein
MKLGFVIILFFALFDAAFARFLPKAFEANLDQIVFSSVKNKEVKTNVSMKYMFPSNIVFNVEGQAPVTYVCNNETTWMYNPPFMEGEKGSVKVGSSSKYCYVKLFDALSNGLKNNKLYTVEKKKKIAHLSFLEKAKAQLNITKVDITFKNLINKKSVVSDIDFMTVYYVGKSKPIKFGFKKINTKSKLKKSDFVFNVPKNTNISNY